MAGIPTPALQFFPLSRGKMADLSPFAVGVVRFATDTIGNMVLTLTHIVGESSIQIETQDGVTVIENRTAAVGATVTEVFTIPAYVSGNTNNDLRIKVRKGSSAPYYQPWETLATAVVGSALIYVSQIPDE